MNTLNLLESLMLEDDKGGRLGEQVPHPTRSIHQTHVNKDRHSFAKNPATASFSEFKMGDIMSRGKVATADPRAGFRGRKVRPGSAINPIAAALNDAQQSRPFSADYRRRTKVGSEPRHVRAKSARWPRQQQGQVSAGHRRSSINSSSVTSSDEDEYVYLDDQDTDEDALSVSDFIGNTTVHTSSPRPGTSHGPSSFGPDRHSTGNRESSRLLSRKKQKKLQLFKNNPEKYYEEKLQQKYSELEVLRSSAVSDRRREVVKGHLQQMGVLHDQYRSASHGHLMSGPIIPQSLPAGARQQRATSDRPRSDRPRSGRPARTGKQASNNRPRSGRQRGDRPVSGIQVVRNKVDRETVVETSTSRQRNNSLQSNESDQESRPFEEVETLVSTHRSEITETLEEANIDVPQNKTTTENQDSSSSETGVIDFDMMTTKVDHHIKNSENEYLQKWLKTKDRQYRRNLKEEKNKKRAEREKLINEANEKLQKRLLSEQMYEAWRKSKSKEMAKKRKEENAKLIMMKNQNSNELAFPGNSVNIKALHADQDSAENFKGDEDIDPRGDEQAETSSWIPPQTKFMYKRPVSGRIKMYYQVRSKSEDIQENDGRASIQVRGKSPTRRPTNQEPNEQEERQSFEKIKRPSIGKSGGRLVNTGRLSRSVDTNTRSKFGEGVEWVRTVYLPEDAQASELTGLQYKRPSTAPPARTDPPMAKNADRLPQRAITTASSTRADPPKAKKADCFPQRARIALCGEQTAFSTAAPSVRSDPPRAIEADHLPSRPATATSVRDSVRTNSSSSELPFPPEKGLPSHVARRQRNLFSDAELYSEDYQRELLHDVLVREGIADIDTQVEQAQEQAHTDEPIVDIVSQTEQTGLQSHGLVKQHQNTEENSQPREFSEKVSEIAEAKDNDKQILVGKIESEKIEIQDSKETKQDNSSVFSSGESSESDSEDSCEFKENIKEGLQDKKEVEESQTVSGSTEKDLIPTTQTFNTETQQAVQDITHKLNESAERREFNQDIEFTMEMRQTPNITKSKSSSSCSSSSLSSDSETEQKSEETGDKLRITVESEESPRLINDKMLQKDIDASVSGKEFQTEDQSRTTKETTEQLDESANIPNIHVKNEGKSEAADDSMSSVTLSNDDDSFDEFVNNLLKRSNPTLIENKSEIKEELQANPESIEPGVTSDNGEKDISFKDKVEAMLASEENDSWYYQDPDGEVQVPIIVETDELVAQESFGSLPLLEKVSLMSRHNSQTSRVSEVDVESPVNLQDTHSDD